MTDPLLPSSQPPEVWLADQSQALPSSIPPVPQDYRLTPSQRPRVWPVFVSFFVLLGFSIGFSAIWVLGAVIYLHGFETLGNQAELQRRIAEDVHNPWVLLTTSAGTTVALFVAAIIGGSSSRYADLQSRLRLGKSGVSWFGHVVLAFGAFSIGTCTQAAIHTIGIRPGGALELLSKTLSHLTPAQFVAAVIGIGLLPGVCEELFFRGFTQTRMIERYGRPIGILLTSVMFGVMHLDVAQGIFATLFGIYLGFIADRAKSIRPAIFCHIVNNSMAVVMSAMGENQAGRVIAGFGLFLLVIGILYAVIVIPLRNEADKGSVISPPPSPMPLPLRRLGPPPPAPANASELAGLEL